MNRDIEHSIHQKLTEYSVDIDATSWLAIEKALNSAKKKKQLTIMRYAAAIVLLLIVSTLSILYFTNTANIGDSKIANHINILPNTQHTEPLLNSNEVEIVEKTPLVLSNKKAVANSNVQKIKSKNQLNQPIAIQKRDYSNGNTYYVDSNLSEGTLKSDLLSADTVNNLTDKKTNLTDTKTSQQSFADNIDYTENTFKPLKTDKHQNNVSVGVLFASNGGGINFQQQNRQIPTQNDSPAVTMLNTFENQVSVSQDVNVNHNLPLSFGLSIQKNINQHIGVETGFMYTYLRSTFSANQIKKTQTLHYIGIPLSAIISVKKIGNFSIYLSAGGMVERNIAYRLTSTHQGDIIEEEDKNLKQLQWSVNTHLGVNYNFYNNVGLYFEPGWGYFFKNNTKIQTYRTEHPSALNFRAGLRVNL